ncbi:MAG: aminotransferase class IV [Deltaproteobacteria bacterium]|nr:aminotransferase class IV [Deltaproteobacteria bacterium]
MDIYYVDGKFVNEDDAVISVKDMSVLRGYGVFDFLRTYDGKPFHLEDHIKRLENSAKLIGIHVPCSNVEIADIVMQTLAKNNHAESNIRLVITGGISPDSITPMDTSKLMVMVTDLHPLPPEWYTKGVKIITSNVVRYMPGAKSTTYLQAIVVLNNARDQGAIESIYVDQNNRLLEGTTTNLFMFSGDKLVTAKVGILPGITRQVLLDILKDEFEIEIRDIDKSEITNADEAFISASNKEIVPVIQIDDLTVGDGKIGPKVRRVTEIFTNYTTKYGRS